MPHDSSLSDLDDVMHGSVDDFQPDWMDRMSMKIGACVVDCKDGFAVYLCNAVADGNGAALIRSGRLDTRDYQTAVGAAIFGYC